MKTPQLLSSADPNELDQLEHEIHTLETQLTEAERLVNAFETQIRSALHNEIRRINELTALYKQQKRDKKAKRLEQKKRGKNYKEPPETLKAKPIDKRAEDTARDEHELKRLYKEAIVRVHPDKFVNDDLRTSEQANALTVQLNAIYESGDLQELKDFHEHILSGNAMAHIPYQPSTIADRGALGAYLRKKRDELAQQLEALRQMHLYTVLQSYAEPLAFIGELRIQFAERIRQLEKRTRTK
jgi:hypothetical protein